jgi:hypothetical protein
LLKRCGSRSEWRSYLILKNWLTFSRLDPGPSAPGSSGEVTFPHVKIAGTVRFREKAEMNWIVQKEREKKRGNFEL